MIDVPPGGNDFSMAFTLWTINDLIGNRFVSASWFASIVPTFGMEGVWIPEHSMILDTKTLDIF